MDHRTVRRRAVPLITRRVLLASGVLTAILLLAFLALAYLPRAGTAGEPANKDGPPPESGQHFAAGDDGASTEDAAHKSPLPAPRDHAMTLSVPELAHADRVPVATGGASDERALREGALHLEGTGFPWQRGANTYIAGHRLGFPGTKSNLLFWDLGELKDGDRVELEDASGRVYHYRVFRKTVVGPNATGITKPVPGKSVVSLQTCTLPDYKERLIVQAELVGVAHGERP